MASAIMETFIVSLPRSDWESPFGNGKISVEDMRGWVERRGYDSTMIYVGQDHRSPRLHWEVFMPSSRVGNAIERFKSFGFKIELLAESIWQD